MYDCEKFEGTPSCTITPSENESDYNTTEENVRIYAYKIRIFVNRTVAPSGQKVEYYADNILRDLVDDVLDKLDKNYTLTGITQPTGYTFINIFATPSAWGYSGRESEYRVCEFLVKARVSIDLSAI